MCCHGGLAAACPALTGPSCSPLPGRGHAPTADWTACSFAGSFEPTGPANSTKQPNVKINIKTDCKKGQNVSVTVPVGALFRIDTQVRAQARGSGVGGSRGHGGGWEAGSRTRTHAQRRMGLGAEQKQQSYMRRATPTQVPVDRVRARPTFCCGSRWAELARTRCDNCPSPPATPTNSSRLHNRRHAAGQQNLELRTRPLNSARPRRCQSRPPPSLHIRRPTHRRRCR